jgi:hypothetical protein
MRALVSPANIITSENLLNDKGKSLIYVLKSRGPKTDAWETPCLIES